MNRKTAEAMIAELAVIIAQITEEYCPNDGYFNLSISRDEGVIHFNNQYWEHALGKLDKALFKEGGEWK